MCSICMFVYLGFWDKACNYKDVVSGCFRDVGSGNCGSLESS